MEAPQLRGTGLVRLAMEALANCDRERLEEIVIQSGELMASAISDAEEKGRWGAEFGAFVAFLEVTQKNLQIFRRSAEPGRLHPGDQRSSTQLADGGSY